MSKKSNREVSNDVELVKENPYEVVTQSESTESIQPEPKTAKEQVETVIYTGESLPGGTLQRYSVFQNGLPKALEVHFEKCPAIKELLVPISDLSETKINLDVIGSREHALNAQIQAYIRGDK